MTGSAILSLEDVWGNPEEGEAPTRMAELRDDRAVDPLDEAEWNSRREALARAIEKLPDRERLVVTLYYFEGLTVKEIAFVLKVSPSRVSQLHTKAVIRLRGGMSR